MTNPTHTRILFITQWNWDDALVQTYTLPYVEIVRKITQCYPYVVTVNNELGSISVKKRGSIISIELPSNKKFLFLGWLRNILALRKIVKKKKIETLHPWCTTAGAVGAILKILNRNLTLNIDSFEPHAEAMVENKTWKPKGLKFRILFYFERLEAMAADHLIFAAPGMEKYIRDKYKTAITNFSVKPACIDLDAFSFKHVKNKELLKKFELEDKIVCVYAGKFGGIYLEDECFAFIKQCENYWGKDKFRFLLLGNFSNEYINEKLSTFNIQHSRPNDSRQNESFGLASGQATLLKWFVPHEDVPQFMGLADFALCPVKPVPTKKYCTPIKDGEYWAMGLPVVITPNISVDSDIIKENNAGAVLESFDEKGYIKAIKQIDSIIKNKNRAEIYEQIRPLAEKYRNFEIAEGVYRRIYAASAPNFPK